MKLIVLATTSIPRKKAFDELQIPYEAMRSDVVEDFKGRPANPVDLVRCLSKLKSESVAKKVPSALVIGFDSVAYFREEILEKPKTRQEAFERLRRFSGQTYQFFTGVHLIDGKETESQVIETGVLMRDINDKEINKYLNQDPNFMRYSQGFDPLNTFGATFIKEMRGSYNNILRGIPLETIVTMLKGRGIEFE